MAHSTTAAHAVPFEARRQLERQEGLPFLDVLSQDTVAQACHSHNHRWRERLYTPWIRLGIFLSQVLSPATGPAMTPSPASRSLARIANSPPSRPRPPATA